MTTARTPSITTPRSHTPYVQHQPSHHNPPPSPESRLHPSPNLWKSLPLAPQFLPPAGSGPCNSRPNGEQTSRKEGPRSFPTPSFRQARRSLRAVIRLRVRNFETPGVSFVGFWGWLSWRVVKVDTLRIVVGLFS